MDMKTSNLAGWCLTYANGFPNCHHGGAIVTQRMGSIRGQEQLQDVTAT